MKFVTLTILHLVILGLIKERNLVLGLTQENSIKSLVQDYLPYIPQNTSLYTTLAYSK